MTPWAKRPGRPTGAQERAARVFIHGIAASASATDAVRIAKLLSFGAPADVVSNLPAQLDGDRDDAPGVPTVRPTSSAEHEARASALDTYRKVAALAGWPLAGPHVVKATTVAPEPPREEDMCIACGRKKEAAK